MKISHRLTLKDARWPKLAAAVNAWAEEVIALLDERREQSIHDKSIMKHWGNPERCETRKIWPFSFRYSYPPGHSLQSLPKSGVFYRRIDWDGTKPFGILVHPKKRAT